MLQSKVFSAVFKKKGEEKPQYIEALIWNDGVCCFTGTINLIKVGLVSSSVYIRKYPFWPKEFYIDIRPVGDNGDYELTRKGIITLEEACEYYDVRVK